MSFLLDTNVLSEPTKPQPDIGVLGWLDAADEDRLYVSAVSFAELHLGIERLPGRENDARDCMSGSVEISWTAFVIEFCRLMNRLRDRGGCSSRAARSGRPTCRSHRWISLGATARIHDPLLSSRATFETSNGWCRS